jgi:glutaredoxin-related protein
LDISKDTLDNYNKNASIEIKKKAVKITIKSLNKSFIHVRDTNELFDYTLYVTTRTLKLVGHMKQLDDKTFTITFV